MEKTAKTLAVVTHTPDRRTNPLKETNKNEKIIKNEEENKRKI